MDFWKEKLTIKTIIDLRNADEIKDNHVEASVFYGWPQATKQNRESHDHSKLRRFNIPIINFRVKLQGLFWEAPYTAKVKTIYAFFNGNPRVTFAKEVFNDVGLIGMNQKILQYSGPNLVKILKICSHQHNHPVVIHCSSGKDRTGLVIALILACCGVEEEDIIENYQISDDYLAPILDIIVDDNRSKGLNETFDETPRFVMQETFKYIKNTWGSVSNYLESIGFTKDQQQALGKVLRESETEVQDIE